jgi:hypothetical protein
MRERAPAISLTIPRGLEVGSLGLRMRKQELAQGRIESGWRLEVADVTHAGKDDQLRGQDGAFQLMRDVHGRSFVGISPDQKRRHLDPGKQIARVAFSQSGCHQTKPGWMGV